MNSAINSSNGSNGNKALNALVFSPKSDSGMTFQEAAEFMEMGKDIEGLRKLLVGLGFKEAANPECDRVPCEYVEVLEQLKGDVRKATEPEPEQHSEPKRLNQSSLSSTSGQDNGKGHAAMPSALTTPTDDDILSLAESSGVSLDAIIQAAEQVETLGHLVLWVEEYKRQQSERLIRESVRRRLDLEELSGKQQELSDRLVAAINKKAPDTEQIAKTLGLGLPPEVNNLAQPDSDWQKDFLSMARQAVGKN